MRAHRLQSGFDRRLACARNPRKPQRHLCGRGQLHTTMHRFEITQRVKHLRRVFTARNNETSGKQNILCLKATNQIEPRLERAIVPFEQQILPRAIIALPAANIRSASGSRPTPINSCPCA